jgi:electron transport complex protein RnfC
VEPAPLTELPAPDTLAIFLGRSDVSGPRLSPSVAADQEVAAAQPLGTVGDLPIVPSPTAGRIAGVKQAPDVRGGKPGLAVLLEPSGNGDAAFAPLDPSRASVDDLRVRLRKAGVQLELPEAADTVVVLAADPEPGITAALSLLLNDPSAAVRATLLVARLAGADRSVLAVLEARAAAIRMAAAGAGIEILPLAAEYPATLPEAVARRVRVKGARPAVIPLARALAALGAVELGRVPSSRVVTILDSSGASIGNFRVSMGTRLGDVFAAAGVEPEPGDKIVTGGLFRGLAQYSLDAAVDATVDALMLIKKGPFRDWSDEPCVNCGWCLDVCPEKLPAHQLTRFAEFSLFDRTPDYGLDDCIECGLCATVCPARRPILQHIRLAKREIAATAAIVADDTAGPTPAPREPDPIAVPVATVTKD